MTYCADSWQCTAWWKGLYSLGEGVKYFICITKYMSMCNVSINNIYVYSHVIYVLMLNIEYKHSITCPCATLIYDIIYITKGISQVLYYIYNTFMCVHSHTYQTLLLYYLKMHVHPYWCYLYYYCDIYTSFF